MLRDRRPRPPLVIIRHFAASPADLDRAAEALARLLARRPPATKPALGAREGVT